MSIAAQFGVSEEDIAGPDATGRNYPPVVQGRVAQIDADFMSYQVAAETKEELDGTKQRRTLESMCARAESGLLHLMRQCGADTYVAHITPSGSNKGGRESQALTLPYQGNRKDRERPVHLDAVRAFIGEKLTSAVHLDQEADDGMAQANYIAIASGDLEKSIIVSKDKDLRMVPGLHWCFDRNQVVSVGDPFGYIWLQVGKTNEKTGKAGTSKLLGWGTKFFWAQLLMGDAADNIKGLPHVTYGALWALNKTPPTLVKLANRLAKENSKSRVAALETQIDAEGKKLKGCGAVMANDLLADCENDRDCYKRVKMLFVALDKNPNYTFINHHTQKPCTATQAMLGDMLLLWMRRTSNPRDVLVWLKNDVGI